MRVPRDVFKRQPVFKDIDEVKDACLAIPSYEDQTFQVKVLELDKYVQAAADTFESGAQTVWRHPKNASTQYEPRTMEDKECQKIIETDTNLTDFLQSTLPL